MIIRKKLDLNNLRYVPFEEVPLRPKQQYENLFKTIPEGQALIIEGNNHNTVRAALWRLQKDGKFLGFYVVERRHGDMCTAYVVNPKKVEE